MLLYKSLYDYGEAEYVVEKSRFIAHAMPVASLDEAKEYVASVKEEYRDATHNVPAIIVGAKQEVQWASDDGEPSGTSGLPMLKLIAGEGLTNLAVVVTRYFGGIKLGTGGLARAYSHAASLAVEKAGICEVRESTLLGYTFDYTYLSKLTAMAPNCGFEIGDIEYTNSVNAIIKCPEEKTEEIKAAINDLTSGKALLTSENKALGRYRLSENDL